MSDLWALDHRDVLLEQVRALLGPTSELQKSRCHPLPLSANSPSLPTGTLVDSYGSPKGSSTRSKRASTPTADARGGVRAPREHADDPVRHGSGASSTNLVTRFEPAPSRGSRTRRGSVRLVSTVPRLERTSGEPDRWVSEVEDCIFGHAVGTRPRRNQRTTSCVRSMAIKLSAPSSITPRVPTQARSTSVPSLSITASEGWATARSFSAPPSSTPSPPASANTLLRAVHPNNASMIKHDVVVGPGSTATQ